MTRLPAGISGKRAPAAATTVKGAQFGENRVLQPTFFKRGVQATHLSFSILQRAQSPEPTGVAGRCEQGWVQMQPTLLSPACNCMPRKPGRNTPPNCAPTCTPGKDTQCPEKPHTQGVLLALSGRLAAQFHKGSLFTSKCALIGPIQVRRFLFPMTSNIAKATAVANTTIGISSFLSPEFSASSLS